MYQLIELAPAPVVTSRSAPSACVPRSFLTADAHGVLRVGDTRVTLDILVNAFRSGQSPEEIREQFPTVDLGDIYAVLTYYLRHTGEVDAYLAAQASEGEQLRADMEARFPPEGIRARLLVRRDA